MDHLMVSLSVEMEMSAEDIDRESQCDPHGPWTGSLREYGYLDKVRL